MNSEPPGDPKWMTNRWQWSARPIVRAAVCLVYVTLFAAHYSSAQIGSWQSHASYRSGQSVAVVGNRVYAATRNGFFCYDRNTNEITTLGKQQGQLSDVGISRLLYLTDQKRLLIAYQNGNLDFLTVSDAGEPGSVKNVNTIATAPDQYSSAVLYHVNRIGNNAYLSTNLGVLVLDLVKDEIKDAYFTQRPDGLRISVYTTAVANDSLYALTDPASVFGPTREVRAIRLAANVNIADPANWRPVSVPDPLVSLSSLVALQGRLAGSVRNRGIYERQSGSWTLTQPLSNSVVELFTTANGLVVGTDQAVTLPGAGPFTGPGLTNPREVAVSGNQVWVADQQKGLLAGSGGTLSAITPEGPITDQFAQLYTYPNTLIGLDDILDSPAGSPASSRFSVPDGRWQRLPDLGGTRQNGNAAAFLPTEQRLYLGSYTSGLWSLAEGQIPVQVALPPTIRPIITNLAADLNGNLWITTGKGGVDTRQTTLHVRRPDGTFQSFPAVTQVNIAQVLPDDNGFLWIRTDAGAGLLVFDPATNRIRFLTTGRGQGGLLTNTIRALAKDRTGAIWVGTDLGPTVFDNPAGAFDGPVDAQPPLLNGRRLLANEVVTSIAVDGGNRKWIGTRTGLYRVAPDGSQLLDGFTADNSPLPNNTIQALAVEPVSGRVFIQTIKGLVSYQGPATEPAEALSKLTIFPNPVRPDFSGTVGINGLTDNATVKVLDAGGQLVYETRSQGGTATWNLRDYRNRPAQTGVYLIVVVAADGTEGLAGKLAVVR